MRRIILSLTGLLLFFSSLFVSKADNEYKLPTGAKQILLRMNYEGVLRADMIGVSYQTRTYLPILDIISVLKIYNKFDYNKRILEGYINNPDSSFKINFQNGNCLSVYSKISLPDSSILQNKTSVYVLPEYFEKIFDIKIKLFLLRLAFNVESKNPLPVLIESKRLKGYTFSDKKNMLELNDDLPLKYNRSNSIINGGILSYSLYANQYSILRNYSFSANLGLEVLGGDFQAINGGYYSENKNTLNYTKSIKWRYNLGENKLLSNISLGDISTAGFRNSSIPSFGYRGIQFTNEMVKYNQFFTNIVYEEKIEPGWQVELYKNGIMVSHVVTDAQGYYKFILPIDYGSSNIELKYYGPKGEFRTKRSLINIPSEFLAPGEIKYALNMGQRQGDNYNFMEARISTGITRWLSNSVSLNKVDMNSNILETINSDFFNTIKNINVFNSLSASIFSNLNLTYNYSYKKLSSVIMNFQPLALGSYRLSYVKYDYKNEFNNKSTNSEVEAMAQLPRISFLPITLNFNYQREDYDRSVNNTLFSAMFFNLGNLICNANYTANYLQTKENNRENNFYHNLSLNFSYNWMNYTKFFTSLSNLSFSLSTMANLNDKKFDNMSLTIGTTIFKYFCLNYKIDKYLRYNKTMNMSLNLRYEFPMFRAQTDIQSIDMKDVTYSEQFQGIMIFNSALKEFNMGNSSISSNIGSGSANIRVFVDANDNGKYDKGEQVIPKVRVKIPYSYTSEETSGGTVQFYNLLAFSKYNVIVDKSSFKNPLWTPKFTEFSFIADPNVTKQIDIPCYVGGVLQGKVIKLEGDKKAGQPGVKVHISSVDSSYIETLPVFSDGSFYKLGIPPGEYTACVDSVQMAILEVQPVTKTIKFKVEKKVTGDIVSGVNFELIPIKSSPAIVKLDNSNSSDSSVNDKKNEISDTYNPNYDTTYKKENIDMSINFHGPGITYLDNNMQKQLDKILIIMKNNPKAVMFIEGCADNKGTVEERYQIAEKRANEVKSYLVVKKGLESERVFASPKPIEISPTGEPLPEKVNKKTYRVDIKIEKR